MRSICACKTSGGTRPPCRRCQNCQIRSASASAPSIAAIAPLLGLLGTVAGIIHAFSAISANGLGDPRILSGGIGEALITTAAGLTVAIPSLIAYRFLRGKVERLVIRMEKEAMKLVDALDERQPLAAQR